MIDLPMAPAAAPAQLTPEQITELSEYYLPQQQGQFDLTLQLFRHPTGTHAVLKYNTSLFAAGTARALADGYVRILRSAAGGALPQRLREVAFRHP